MAGQRLRPAIGIPISGPGADAAGNWYTNRWLNRPTTLTDTGQALTHLYEPWGTVSAIVRNGAGSGRWTTPDGRLISLSHYNDPLFTLDGLE